MVVGTQNEDHVLERDYQHQCPKDGGDCADQVGFVQRHAGVGRKHLFDGIQRAGANIAIHNAERAQGECAQALFAEVGAALLRGLLRCTHIAGMQSCGTSSIRNCVSGKHKDHSANRYPTPVSVSSSCGSAGSASSLLRSWAIYKRR